MNARRLRFGRPINELRTFDSFVPKTKIAKSRPRGRSMLFGNHSISELPRRFGVSPLGVLGLLPVCVPSEHRSDA
jgi:hypothetical protein